MMLSIKPNREVTRKARSLSQRANYKASELRSILLFYFPVCINKLLPDAYVTHFRRLSSAIYTLLKDKITANELSHAHHNLTMFVNDFQTYFGKKHMVMNIHLLSHIVQCVESLGPLWSQSTFAFERNNECLLKFVNGTTDVLEQISNEYIISKNIQESNEPIAATVFMGKKKLTTIEFEEFVDIHSNVTITINNREIPLYARLNLGGVIYTSLMYKKIKTIDYFVRLQTGDIGTVKYYANRQNQKYVFLQEYEILENIDHIFEVETTGIQICSSVDQIIGKYLYMFINQKHYITAPPNMFEKE